MLQLLLLVQQQTHAAQRLSLAMASQLFILVA
jgi:hypothetical protein